MRRLLPLPTVAGLLAYAGGSPASALHALTDPGPGGPVTAPLVAGAALLAWAGLAWLVLLAALTLLAQRRGRAGRIGTGLLRWAAPAALRQAVALALGVGVVLGSAGVAGAAPPPGPATTVSTPAVPGLDWPGVGSPAPAAPAPAPAPAAPVPSPGAAARDSPATVVVRPGDTLWGLAARQLPAGAGPREVAAAWPAWWSANRAVIGADPDLLRPGQSLTPPASAGQR